LIRAFDLPLYSQSNKSCELYGLGPNIIKLCKDYIALPITSLINNSIASGIFPDLLKLAGVIPLHKGGGKDNPNNYRPISILPTISKIFERHVANQLNEYFRKTNILHNHQSGFREHHSCQTALIRLVDSWLTNLDDGNIVGTVFIDFKKAFDLVDHEILLYKLRLYHFSDNTLNFFRSYLSNRKQRIKADGVKSEFKTVMTGVPQGSIIGPLLFLIYVNDLPLQTISEIDMYADDSTLHKTGKNLQEIQMQLQSDLTIIQNWCCNNNMAVNPSKTTCMVISSRKKSKQTG
jgi:retron-type reverse transcriptase